ncbi:maltokinase N-terminal cap-like domain-containing protein [Saccharothrix xinjiangensis]|uniref:Maltokinase N-terminal cap domain-containing protein n=1 Tax=Saccharothrix xinjiangensis TaxID=204798 RepID=A0ABV9XWC0_9PSEU
MAKIHAGATLTPGFREFLPPWVARQPWYRGSGVPALSPVGFFRFEDPAGEVGVETHLLAHGADLYHVPMTYRGAPLAGAAPGALVGTTEHSVLGARWVYDAEADPVWRDRVLDLVRTGGVADPSGRGGVGPAGARGEPLGPVTDGARVELVRLPTPGVPEPGPDVVGLVTGTWRPGGPGAEAVGGCLVVVRRAA